MPQENYSVGYDQAAAEFFGRRRANTHAAFFLPHLRAGMRLLDGGCGPGTMTIDLAQIVAPGELIDIEPSQIELAGAKAAEPMIESVGLLRLLDQHAGAKTCECKISGKPRQRFGLRAAIGRSRTRGWNSIAVDATGFRRVGNKLDCLCCRGLDGSCCLETVSP